MNPKRILIYLGILAIVAGYVYFVEIKHKEKTRAREDQAEKIVNLNRDDIVSLELQSQDNPKIELKKPAGQWVLTEPVKTKGDDAVIDTLLHSIVTGKREKVVKDTDVNWAEFGLDKPSLVATLGTKDRVDRIAFGSTNPSKSSYYVRVNENPQLLLVTDAFRNAVRKNVFDLRDKSVMAVAAPDVERLVIVKDGVETELKREAADKWLMIKPESIKVKKSLAENIVRNLSTLRARDIIDKPSDKPGEYGFDKPELVATLAGKDREETLVIGKTSGEAKGTDRYATIKGQNTVYVIDTKATLALKTDPATLQDRSLVFFEPQDIDKLTVTLDGSTWEAVRQKNNKWDLERPQQKKGIEAWTVAKILWDLKDLEWKAKEKSTSGGVAKSQLDNPKLVVSIAPKDGKPPIELKAGWEDKKLEAPANQTDAGSTKTKETGKPEATAEGKTPSPSDKTKTPEAPPAVAPPDTVYAVVAPEEEPGTVFVLEGAFLKKLRDGLKGLEAPGK